MASLFFGDTLNVVYQRLDLLPRLLKRPLQTALLWTLYEELKPRLTRVLG